MHPLPVEPSVTLTAGFYVLPIVMVGAVACLVRSWIFLAFGLLWAIAMAAIALSGWPADFSGMPPRVAFLLVPTFGMTFLIAFSRLGRPFVQLSLSWLIGIQAFRIAVEILIHQAVIEGVAPPQFTWSGLNLDIITGITAIPVALLASRCPKSVLLIWNTIGLGLVLWVVGVAILSLPTEFQRITPDNVWVAYFPFVWLPTILVAIAIYFHLVLYRKLLWNEVASANDAGK